MQYGTLFAENGIKDVVEETIMSQYLPETAPSIYQSVREVGYLDD